MASSTFSTFRAFGQRSPAPSRPLPDRSLNPFWQGPIARQGPLNFIGLPLEVKELIYELVLGANTSLYVAWNDPDSTHSGGNPKNTYGLPAICFTSKVERAIAIQAFLCATTLCLLWNIDATLTTHWLRKITEKKEAMFDSVRALEISYIKRPFFNNRSEDAQLLAACTSLVSHTLTLTVEELDIRDNGNPGDPTAGVLKVRGITGEEWIASMSMAPLLDFTRLRCLTVNIWTGCDGPLKASVGQVNFVVKTLQWWKVEFEAKHRRAVQFVLQWHRKK